MALTTVLTTLSARDLANTQLLLQMDRYNTSQRAVDQTQAAGASDHAISGIKRQIDGWGDLRKDLLKTTQFLEGMVRKVESIRDTVGTMTTTAYSARNQSTLSSGSYKFRFDAGVRSINSAADDNGLTPNLIGSAEVSDYKYYTDLSGDSQTVGHYALGTDYYIVDTGGKKWVREPEAQLVLQRRDADSGATTGEQASLSTGIRLDSYDRTTNEVTFTIQPGTSEEASFTGTLHASGLKVLDSWLYDSLTSSAGRSNALEDLHKATSVVKVQLAKYNGALAKADFHNENANTTMTGLASKIDALTTEQLLALQKTDTERQLVSGLNRAKVEASTAIRREYFKMFETNPFTRALVDVLA